MEPEWTSDAHDPTSKRKRMRFQLTVLAIAGLFCAGNARAENKKVLPPDRVSIYQVSLVCPAAPQIGYGTRAKPVLLALERETTVAEAWLNRAGTLMAIEDALQNYRPNHD